MNKFERKVTVRVLGIHVGVVAILICQSALKSCFRPKPKNEIITFVDFGSPGPSVDIKPVQQMDEPKTPEPEKPQPKPDIPKPIPKPKPAPEVLKPKPTVTKPKPKPKPQPAPEPEKPKWKPVDPKDIKMGTKVEATPTKPAISASDIQQLSKIASQSTATGNPSQFNDYYAQIMRLFYQHWTPPASASSATGSTIVRISIRPTGQIVKRTKMKSSGDSIYDSTVMDAANAVSTLPKPPSNYPYDYVEVVFTLDN